MATHKGSITIDLAAGPTGISTDPQAGFDRSITQIYLPSEVVAAIGDAVESADDRGGNFWPQVAPYFQDPRRLERACRRGEGESVGNPM